MKPPRRGAGWGALTRIRRLPRVRRRVVLDSLYDVFVNVRNDEKHHWETLCNLVQYDALVGSAPAQSSRPGNRASPRTCTDPAELSE